MSKRTSLLFHCARASEATEGGGVPDQSTGRGKRRGRAGALYPIRQPIITVRQSGPQDNGDAARFEIRFAGGPVVIGFGMLKCM